MPDLASTTAAVLAVAVLGGCTPSDPQAATATAPDGTPAGVEGRRPPNGPDHAASGSEVTWAGTPVDERLAVACAAWIDVAAAAQRATPGLESDLPEAVVAGARTMAAPLPAMHTELERTDAVVPTEVTAAVQELHGLLRRYAQLVEDGRAGPWEVEPDPTVAAVDARVEAVTRDPLLPWYHDHCPPPDDPPRAAWHP